MKKIICFLMGVAAAITITTTCTVKAEAMNRQWWDTTYNYDTAYIGLPDGSMIQGKVDSWIDYENSDTVQIKIGGKTYLTHYSNVVLVDE